MKVWVYHISIANVLSLSQVSKEHRVIMDSAVGNVILVEVRPDKWMRLSQNGLGFFVCDVRSDHTSCNVHDIKDKFTLYSFVQTVTESASKCTAEEINLAKVTRDLSKRIGST